MPKKSEQESSTAFLENDEEKDRFKKALAEIEPDLEKIEAELDDCQRLSEEDFVVRINARD